MVYNMHQEKALYNIIFYDYFWGLKLFHTLACYTGYVHVLITGGGVHGVLAMCLVLF